ncbi:MAG: leucine-rich repeat domain-containing protein, partial [Clostridia bacterium]|nr:leucine-rich repeat domain-containing protein [Clostridia bacterium]
MTKSRRLLSIAVAVFMVFSMFSFVYADPSGWDAAGYLYPGTMGTNSTGFNWRYKKSELQIDFAPAAYSGTTSSVNDFYICFNKAQAGNACKVVCSYLGNENFPSLKFYGNSTREYVFVFDSSMSNTLTLDYVNLQSISVETTKKFNLNIEEFNSSYMPTILTNNSESLSISTKGCTKTEITIDSSYGKENVDFKVRNSSVLKKANIDSSITTIPASAFSQDTALTSVNIPSSVTSIEYSAFYQNTSLKEIHIPKSVKTIRPDAFEDSGLKNIYYDGTKKDWNEINIYETYFDEN